MRVAWSNPNQPSRREKIVISLSPRDTGRSPAAATLSTAQADVLYAPRQANGHVCWSTELGNSLGYWAPLRPNRNTAQARVTRRGR